MNDTWWVRPDQLDNDQKSVVDIPIDKNCLILGPPGSGKTNLLLLRASYLVKAGYPNIIILVFNRTLQEFLATGASNYAFSTDKIMTSNKWMLDLIRQYNRKIELKEDFKERREQLLVEVEKLVQEENIGYLHEAILLDEAQDYLPEEIRLFSKLSKRIFAVADSRQKIYLGEDPLKLLKNIVDEKRELRYHYRNGLIICQLADGIAKVSKNHELLSSTSNYHEQINPSIVETFSCSDLCAQCQLIIKRLDPQLKAYPNEFIGIVTPRREELDAVWRYISHSPFTSKAILQSGVEGYIPFDSEKPIIVSTLHGAKGLEFRAFHIVACEFIKKFAQQRNMSFMGTTRVKTSLSIYHSNDLPGYLEQAYINIQRPQKIPRIEELFDRESK